MELEERFFQTLLVSSSEKVNEKLLPLLASVNCAPVAYAENIAAAKRMALENTYDCIIINSPLPDDQGVRFAKDQSSGKSTVCLLLVKSELYPDIRKDVTPYGVFTLAKPMSSSSVIQGLEFLTAARERLRSAETKTLTIEEKMEEIRLVNRAKWLLIDHEGMSEPLAHRYIEKTAMDRCVTRSVISKEIIDKYN